MSKTPYFRTTFQIVPCTGLVSGSTSAINSATTYFGFSFIALVNNSLNYLVVHLGKTGTPTDIRAALYTDVNGLPNPAGAIPNTETGAVNVNIASTSYITFTFNTAYTGVTAGNRYWVVLKNYTATPASNYPTVTYCQVYGANSFAGDACTHSTWGFGKATTNTGDSGWGGAAANITGGAFIFSDGLRLGSTFKLVYSTMASTSTLWGIRFNAPDVVMSVDSITAGLYKLGAPTSPVVAKIFINGSLAATSLAIPAAAITTTNGYISFNFPAPVTIPPLSVVTAAIGSNGSGTMDGSNAYRLTGSQCASDEAMAYKATSVASVNAGVTWADNSATLIPSIVLGLEAGNLCKLPALNRRKINATR